MQSLSDEILRNIFSKLDFNQKLRLKFLCQQFNRVINRSFSETSKLIIFDRMPPISGRFKYTDEEFDFNHSIYVTNLNKFFKMNRQYLKNVEKLVIFGLKKDTYELDFVLKNLYQLELYDCKISNALILNSPKLSYLFNQNVDFENLKSLNDLTNISYLTISAEIFLKICHLIKQLEYLEIPESIKLLDGLDRFLNLKIKNIKINSDLETAIKICEKFECIEKLDVNLKPCSGFERFMTRLKMRHFLIENGDRLKFSCYNIKLTKNNLDYFFNLDEVLSNLDNESQKLNLNIFQEYGQEALDQIEYYDKFLLGFHSCIRSLKFDDLIINNTAFNKLSNVEAIFMNLKTRSLYEDDNSFNKFFCYFPELKHLEINTSTTIKLKPNLFNALPDNCKKLIRLRVQCYNENNFEFIAKLKNLKYLIVTSYPPIKNKIFAKILQQLNYLAYFRFSFSRPKNNFSKDELSKFQKRINSMAKDELNYKNSNFMITLHTFTKSKKSFWIVKYTFVRKNLKDEQFKYHQEKEDYDRLCKMILANENKSIKGSE